MQKQLGQLLSDRMLIMDEIRENDYSCLFELMAKYQDRPMDLADGTLVIVA